MKYPDDFKPYEAAALNNTEINNMLQQFKKIKSPWISSANIIIVRVDEEDYDSEILICRIIKSATLAAMVKSDVK